MKTSRTIALLFAVVLGASAQPARQSAKEQAAVHHHVRRAALVRPALPTKTKSLFRQLNRWLDQNVAVKYTPLVNPDYDPAKEVRAQPFVDLRQQMLGKKSAIRPATSDPRIQELSNLNRESAAPKNAPAH